MKETLKKLSAGLLTLTVIGGVGGLLTMSLADAQPKQAVEQTASRPEIETVVVYGHRPANYANLISHKKQIESVGSNYAAAQQNRFKVILFQ